MTIDLADTWTAIAQELDKLGVAVFPRTPEFLDRPLNVFWPGDDWSAFLELALKAGCSIVYAQAEALGAIDGTVQLTLPEVEQAIEFGQYDGCVGNIELVFVIGSVMHSWCLEADWYDDFHRLFNVTDRNDAGDFRESHRTEVERDLAEFGPAIEEAANRLAATPEFLAMTFPGNRRDVALDLDSEMHQWSKEGHYEVANAALDRAIVLAEDERSRRVEAALVNVDELAAELLADPNYLGLAKVRQGLAKQFVVKTLGFRSPQLADRIYMRASTLGKH